MLGGARWSPARGSASGVRWSWSWPPGADVVLSYHHSGAGAESAVAEIEEKGAAPTSWPPDLGRYRNASAGRCRRRVSGDWISWSNNAGVTITKPFDEVTPRISTPSMA